MQAEQNLRKAEACVVDGDAKIAGERHFEPTAQAKAMDHPDRWQRQPVEPVDHGVALGEHGLDLACIADTAELRDVGAGDKAGAFRRTDHQAARLLALELLQNGVELDEHVYRERIGA